MDKDKILGLALKEYSTKYMGEEQVDTLTFTKIVECVLNFIEKSNEEEHIVIRTLGNKVVYDSRKDGSVVE